MALKYPVVRPITEVLRFKRGLSGIKEPLAIGPDGRARAMLNPFGLKTGRNRFTPTSYVLIRPEWQRTLFVRPAEGEAIALIDYSGQELAVAAALSGDEQLASDYNSGDMHSALAVAAGLMPVGGSKQEYAAQRAAAKAANFLTIYGGGVAKLAATIRSTEAFANNLLTIHRRRYPRLWKWADGMVSKGRYLSEICTLYDWKMRVLEATKDTTIRNFCVQANAAEMTRLAVCMAIEDGVSVCGPIHDALLIVAPGAEIDDAVAAAQGAMSRASHLVRAGFETRTDVQVARFGEELADGRADPIRKLIDPILGITATDQTAVSETLSDGQ